MAYPGSLLPSSFYYLDAAGAGGALEATPPSGKKFVAYTAISAGNVTFKSAENDVLFQKNAGGTAYEGAGLNGVSIIMAAGQTIYGTFSAITTSTKGVAYVG